MSDLIDRKMAIDALGEKPLAWVGTEYELGLQKQWQSDVNTLKKLPSAQPEETFEFGKWYDFKCGYVLETTVHSFRILKDVEASSNG